MGIHKVVREGEKGSERGREGAERERHVESERERES